MPEEALVSQFENPCVSEYYLCLILAHTGMVKVSIDMSMHFVLLFANYMDKVSFAEHLVLFELFCVISVKRLIFVHV